jgi:glucosamine--fructose-6-phosphate aminotransferase (isomerizing)
MTTDEGRRMCGIVGYVGTRESIPILLEGLERLEYRGYDSAGIAVHQDGALTVRKAKGKVSALQSLDLPFGVPGPGIGHTRWATHGEPSDGNAHPHIDQSGRIAVVHNGIIENASLIRERLQGQGVVFTSETDSEVLAHLIAAAAAETDDLAGAVRQALAVIEGTYGIAVLDARDPGCIVVARNGSPVVIGVGNGENFVASDTAAIVRYTQQAIFLEDGDLAVIRADGFQTYRLDSTETTRRAETINWGLDTYEMGDHSHYMHKEIFEQPDAVQRTLSGRLDPQSSSAHLGGVDLEARDVLRLRRVKILGCGSAFYAGLAGANLIERLARIPAEAEPASEFRYRNPIIEPETLYVVVSQSGETLDTLRAVQEIKRKGGRVLGVVNVVGSSIARESGIGIYLHAGPEVSVASTKAFTCTVAGLAVLALHLGRVRDLGAADGDRLIAGLNGLPDKIAQILKTEDHIAEVAERFASATSAMFVGRVGGYPVALEGSQKLKEITYIHAEAYPSAELKHGPLALIGPDVPSVTIVPDDELFDKNLSTMSEIRSRRGPVIAVGHSEHLIDVADEMLLVPKSEPELDPLLLGIPLQLLAYHVALARGVDVDQPRNLAKSVTVE